MKFCSWGKETKNSTFNGMAEEQEKKRRRSQLGCHGIRRGFINKMLLHAGELQPAAQQQGNMTTRSLSAAAGSSQSRPRQLRFKHFWATAEKVHCPPRGRKSWLTAWSHLEIFFAGSWTDLRWCRSSRALRTASDSTRAVNDESLSLLFRDLGPTPFQPDVST